MDIYMNLSAFKECKGNGRQFKAFLSLSKVEKFKIRKNVHISSSKMHEIYSPTM